MIKNTEHIDFNDRNITDVRFFQVNQLPKIDSHLTAELHVVNSIDEISLVRTNQDIDFNKYNITNINSVTLNTQEVNDNEVITKAYIDQFHQKNERSGRNLRIDFYDESNDLVKINQNNDLNDNKLSNLDSITVNRNPTSDNEVSNKRYIDDELDKNTVLRFSQTLQSYLEVSVGSDTYNLTKYDKIQITDTTIIKYPNSGGYLLQTWVLKCNDKKNKGKLQNFIRSTKPTSGTANSGAGGFSSVGDSFMYTETSFASQGHERNFVSWERTDILQITYLTFSSISNNDTLKSMGRFRIQLLLEDITWSTQYTIAKNDRYSDSDSEWTLLNSNFTVENCGIIIIYDQIDTAHADMCFSNFTITNSVY